MQEQKQQKRGNGSHGNGQKKRLEKLKKVLDKITDTRYNIKARSERASLEKGENIENFIV